MAGARRGASARNGQAAADRGLRESKSYICPLSKFETSRDPVSNLILLFLL